MLNLLKKRFTLYQTDKSIKNFFNGIPLIINKDSIYDNIYFQKKVDKIPKGNYILCDLEGTILSEDLMGKIIEEFLLFLFYSCKLRNDSKKYLGFLYDFEYFNKLLNNKDLNNKDFLLVCEYFIFSYKEYIVWNDFLKFLSQKFDFSRILLYNEVIKKIEESKGDIILISGAHGFIVDIYVEVFLKFKIPKKIYYFSSYVDFKINKLYNLWSYEQKQELLNLLFSRNKNINVVGSVGDTVNDICFFDFCDEKSFKLLINPTADVMFKINTRQDKTSIKYFFTEKGIFIRHIDIKIEQYHKYLPVEKPYFYNFGEYEKFHEIQRDLWYMKMDQDKFYYEELFFFYKWGKYPQTNLIDDYHINSNFLAAQKFVVLLNINLFLQQHDFDSIVVIPTKRNMINELLLEKVKIPIILVSKDRKINFSSRKTKGNLKKIIYSRRVFSIDNSIRKYNNVLLIDDVFRTGITLNEVSKKIKEQGVERVTCLCYFQK